MSDVVSYTRREPADHRPGDYDYPLEPELIAQQPLADRTASRLMVLRRDTGELAHQTFADLPTLLRGGDLLVLNNTAVVAARFFCRRDTGGRIEGLFLRQVETGRWETLLKDAARCRPGERLTFEGAPEVGLTLGESLGLGRYIVQVDPPTEAAELLQRAGITPLPPYIHRHSVPSGGDDDRARYQTVYAATPGAVAAPTAGLHFSDDLFDRLKSAGVMTAEVTLHVGLGTFAPVKAERITEHKMHSEWLDLPAATAEAVNAARRDGRRIIAVGTTSVRVLETAAAATPPPHMSPASGWTDIFIYPPREFGAVDALITNFHLPRSTLLMLVAAFCSPGRTDGIEMIKRAYAEAARLRYRFFSYGDAMLIV